MEPECYIKAVFGLGYFISIFRWPWTSCETGQKWTYTVILMPIAIKLSIDFSDTVENGLYFRPDCKISI